MNTYFSFSSHVTVGLGLNTVHPLLSELWHGFCFGASDASIVEAEGLTLCIGNADTEAEENTLHVTQNGVFLRASDERILTLGYLELLQKIECAPEQAVAEQLRIPVGDTPIAEREKLQMLHLCVFPETTLSFLQKTIRLAGVLRYTHVMLEFWGTYQFSCLKELAWKDHSFTKDEIAPLVAEANALGMEVIPMFNHLGHAAGSRVRSGKHVVLDQNPRLAPLFGDDGWSWNIENPHARTLLKQIRAELYELCGSGSYFHIGCDESYTYCASEEHAPLLARYLSELCEEVIAEGRRPILWGDMLLCRATIDPPSGQPYECNAYSEATAKLLLDALPKQAIIADWHYDINETPWRSTKYLSSLGFEVLSCPWYKYDNILSAAQTIQQCNTLGMLETTWHFLSSAMHVILYSSVAHLPQDSHLLHTRMGTQTATLLRKVWFAKGDYAEAGWARKQTDDRV